MAIYFLVFFISIVFMRIAYKNIGKSAKKVHISLFISATALIVLAACRGDHVGTDILAYQKDLYVHALRIRSLVDYIRWSYEEPGYSFLTFLGARLGHFAYVHALNMCLIIVPMYYLIWDAKEVLDPDISLGVFLFLYYVQGYNVVRQQIAISLVTLGLNQFTKKRYLFSIVLLLSAILFHYSAIVGAASYILYWMSISRLKTLHKGLFFFVISFVTINFVTLGKTFGAYMVRVLRISKISYSSSLAWISKTSKFNETYLLLGTIGIIILLLTRNNVNSKNIKWINKDFLLYMMMIMMVSTILTKNMGYVSRVFCYFEIWVVFVIPRVTKLVHDDWRSKIIARFMLFAALATFWIIGVVIKGWHGVYPYYAFWQSGMH